MTDFPFRSTYQSPHFCFHVHTNDQKVLDFIESYLDFSSSPHHGSRLFELHYCITYVDRATLAYEDRIIHSAGSHSKVSATEYVVQTGEKAASVHINVDTMRVTADLYSLDHGLGAIDLVFFYPCRMLLAYRKWLYIHGALVQSATHDVIFVGASGAGKTSLAYSLAADPGYCQRSDDILFIHADQHHNYCLPLPTKVGFRNKALENEVHAVQEQKAFYGGKKRFSFPASVDACHEVTARATVIIHPHYDEHLKELKVDPIVNRQGFVEAVGDATLPMCDINIWPLQYHDACLTLTTFMRRAEIYHLTYNDALLGTLPALMAGRW